MNTAGGRTSGSDDLTYFLIRATPLAQRFRGERGPRLQACLPVPACMSLRFSSQVNVIVLCARKPAWHGGFTTKSNCWCVISPFCPLLPSGPHMPLELAPFTFTYLPSKPEAERSWMGECPKASLCISQLLFLPKNHEDKFMETQVFF